jgi:uncharacterized membrane protein
MIPLLGVVLGTLLLRVVGARGGPWRSWRTALVPPLGLMYVLTGLAHFTPIGEDLARFIPQAVPHPRALVLLSGALQIGGGIALFSRRWRSIGAVCLIVLLLIKLPLNWLGASHGLMVRGPFPTPPLVRVPLVLLWIAALAWIGADRQRSADAAADSTPSRK